MKHTQVKLIEEKRGAMKYVHYFIIPLTAFLLYSGACIADTAQGSLFKNEITEDCEIRLRFPTVTDEEQTLESQVISAGGEELRCSSVKKDQNWLYFSATTDESPDTWYDGLLAIMKTGVTKLEVKRRDGQPVRWRAAFNAETGEHYYGFGINSERFDHHGFAAGNSARGANGGVPFFSSSRGYGAWLDGTAPAAFDMDTSATGRWSVDFQDNYLRIYFFAGPFPTDIISRYTSFTGRPPLWPAWVFAPWKSRDVHTSGYEVEEDILRQRKLDLPGSAILIDSPWEDGYNSFRFNSVQFPDPAALMKKARDYGYRAVLWMTPITNVDNRTDMLGIKPGKSSNFDLIEENGGFVINDEGETAIIEWEKGRGALFDFTNPAIKNYLTGVVERLAEMGADGFMADGGSDYCCGPGWRFFDDTVPPRRMKNLYLLLYGKTVYEAWKEAGVEPVIAARGGVAGSQQYSIQWHSDTQAGWGPGGLSSAVVAAQSAAMSGFSVVGHDIAGYYGEQSPELFARWTQFGALSPVMAVYMQSNRGPWDFGAETLDIYRDYAKLHTSLFPYIYKYAKEASETGLPVIRPLPLLYPAEPEAHVQRYQYLLGNSILVAPVVEEGAVWREVYFPGNMKWYEFWGDITHEGGTLEVVDAPIEELPFFIREGAIIPMLPGDVDTLAPAETVAVEGVVPADDRLVVRVWPPVRNSSFRMADGTYFSARRRDGIFTLEIKSRPRRLWVDIASTSPGAVMIDSEPLESISCEDVAAMRQGWCSNQDLANTLVFINSEEELHTLTISD